MTVPARNDPLAAYLRAGERPVPPDLADALAAFHAARDAARDGGEEAGDGGGAWDRLVEAGDRHGVDIQALSRAPPWTIIGQVKQQLAKPLLRRLMERAGTAT